MRHERGFTLLEVLLSVSIIGTLALISMPLQEAFVRRTDLDLTTQSVVAALRRAQTYSRGMHGDSTWGVRIDATVATLFRGTTYATRTATYDETIAIPASITPSGTNEVVFAKLSGTPNLNVTTTLTSTENSTRTITVNAKGNVNY